MATIKSSLKKEEKEEAIVYHSNELIQNFHHKLTLHEQRIFCLLLSKVQKHDKEFYPQTFSFENLGKLIGVSMGGKTRKYLDTAITNMVDKSFWCIIDDEETKMNIGFLARGSLSNIKKGFVTIKLCDTLKPFLTGRYDENGKVIKPYTRYALQIVSKFHTPFSLPLYEYLKYIKIKKRNWTVTLTVETLRSMLNADPEQTWQNFRRYGIESPVKEINEHSDILIKDVEYIKHGKFIGAVRFHCTMKSGYSAEEDMENGDKENIAAVQQEDDTFTPELVTVPENENF